ncbi:hypothetical protein [Myxococcus sp. AB036A]|uniref:hypothetical protein n=1 Tax=Myxococcus sp. AB036A TaxID=2562793 RepID=UPI00189188F0|nr:hypothetical protein [Myxococcus sp. AB036A]
MRRDAPLRGTSVTAANAESRVRHGWAFNSRPIASDVTMGPHVLQVKEDMQGDGEPTVASHATSSVA